VTGLLLLSLMLAAPPSPAPPPKPQVGEGLRKERERLASYQWRMKTEMTVDGNLRVVKLEDVHLDPDGSLIKKTVRYEHKPAPTLPDNDPRVRAGTFVPPTGEEDESLFDQAQQVMQSYTRITPERLDAWAAGAEPLAEAPDRKGQLRLHGRGLLLEEDDAVLYLDAKTKAPKEMEIKTAVANRKGLDVGFLRVTLEELPPARPGLSSLIVPKKIFLNMNRGKRTVKLEMETSEYRTWP